MKSQQHPERTIRSLEGLPGSRTGSGPGKRWRPHGVRAGGAVIILSLAMLMTLLFLGLFFYSFMDDEANNADNYASAEHGEIDHQKIMDHALEQVIVATDPTLKNSALYGSRWSLLAHVIGRLGIVNEDANSNGVLDPGEDLDGNGRLDVHIGAPLDARVHNGRGILLRVNGTTGRLEADYDWDGTFDPFVLNYSAPANGGTPVTPQAGFQPDAGYTYPDQNALFLCYEEFPLDGSAPTIKPSFFLPDHFRFEAAANGVGPGNYFIDASLGRMSLRPHAGHGQRYLNQPTPNGVVAQSGDRNRRIFNFPFRNGSNQFGRYTSSGSNYEYDIDADRDGWRDSILVDMDYGLINLPDGRQVVPIYFFKIVDTNGLMPLNIAGNPRANYVGQIPANRTESRSNLALSLAELNPGWCFYASPYDSNFLSAGERPGVMQLVYGTTDFGPSYSSGEQRRYAASNFAFSRIVLGDGAGVDGRLGSDDMPGGPGDDDNDRLARSGRFYRHNFWGPFYTPLNSPVRVDYPSVVHPTDRSGRGRSITAPPSAFPEMAAWKGARSLRVNSSLFSWQRYNNYEDQATAAAQPASYTDEHLTWRNATTVTTQNLRTPPTDYLTNEPDELLLEPMAGSPDSPFSWEELASLHLSDADWQRVGRASRLRALAKFQFDLNYEAQRIRRQFSTTNYDRSEFSFGPVRVSGGNRDWEFSIGTRNEFPPNFGSVSPGAANYPFRPEIWRLLRTRLGRRTPDGLPQQKLRLNAILADDTAYGGPPAFGVQGEPLYRPLVPHPHFNSSGTAHVIEPMYHGGAGSVPHQFTDFDGGADPEAQEWWARYDRQRLARDIYVLLYLLGGGNDGINYASTSGVYTAAQTREMAQFAVNLVDAMDRDRVITEFQYDPDLSNGWDTSGTTLRRVQGIESLDLCFSEALAITTVAKSMDDSSTKYDDQEKHNFLYVELRNVSPYPVSLRYVDDLLGTPSNDHSSYRLVRIDGAGTVHAVLEFERDVNNVIGPGENFVIACHDGTVGTGSGMSFSPHSATFYVDHDSADGDFEAIVPYGVTDTDGSLPTSPSANPEPLADLDLNYVGPNDHQGRFNLVARYGATGTLVGTTDGSGTSVILSLQRRRHPFDGDTPMRDAAAGGNEANDWIEIDRMEIDFESFNVGTTALHEIDSSPRGEPLARSSFDPAYDDGGTDPRNHTLGDPTNPHQANANFENGAGNGRFEVWQPHFDRELTSVMELLSIPLYGYAKSNLANSSNYSTAAHGGPTSGLARRFGSSPNRYYRLTGDRTAGLRFRNPQPTLTGIYTGVTGHYQNRWFRLLNMLELEPSFHSPRLSNIQRARLQSLRRRASGINLNTLRNDHVLAGIIDDIQHHDPFVFDSTAGASNHETPTLDRRDHSGIRRHWYQQLKMARDGRTGGNARPAGSLQSRPFRPLTYIDPYNPNQSIRNTILRQHNSASSTLNQMGLFEARTTDDVGTGQGHNTVDYYTSNRLLSKVHNLTTTRSHNFVVWCGYQFHEAHERSEDLNGNGSLDPGEDLNGNGEIDRFVQIGNLADDVPGHREFLVVDMTRLEEAYNSRTGTFSFKPFIVHREVLP